MLGVGHCHFHGVDPCTVQGCSRSYCARCRALWHEGECAQLGEDAKASKQFGLGVTTAHTGFSPHFATGVSPGQGLDGAILLAPVKLSRMQIFVDFVAIIIVNVVAI